MYFDMVYRICYLYMNGCGADSEDACQQVFLKYMEHGGGFDSGEHEKAWLIVTAQNTCKSMLRRVYRRHVSLSEAENVMVEDKADGTYTAYYDTAQSPVDYNNVQDIVICNLKVGSVGDNVSSGESAVG